MNRELKFRVWNGSEMVYDVTVGKLGVFYVNPTNNGLDLYDSASITPLNTKYPDSTPVMQYTGLKDKNGKEINEYDVVLCGGKQRTIKWANGKFWFVAECSNQHEDISEMFGKYYGKVEVIGNIYENPELLQQPQTVN
jgi:uncharacterized phage protein (TIGR01671 family)